MKDADFQSFLSGIASRLRHDLKGGLISLRMGLEMLSDEEDLKPLLVERAQSLEMLSDKLIMLLRVGCVSTERRRLSALLGEFRIRVAERYPRLEVMVPQRVAAVGPLDVDALGYALLELAENAWLAGARHLRLRVEEEGEGVRVLVDDDGHGTGDVVPSIEELGRVGVSRWGRSGLGLAIVKACVLGHGGSLELGMSELGGVEVQVLLPGCHRE